MHGTLELARFEIKWTDERIETLKRMIEEKCSATDVGIELKLTRNAVIGKAHRLGLRFQSQERTNKPKPRVEPRVRVRRAPRAALPEMAPEPDAKRLTVQQLKSKSCRYIVTDDHPMLYCGHEKAEGFSYCAHHCRIVYSSADKRRPLTAYRWVR